MAAALTGKSVTKGLVDVVCISESEKLADPRTAEEHAVYGNVENQLTSSWLVE